MGTYFFGLKVIYCLSAISSVFCSANHFPFFGIQIGTYKITQAVLGVHAGGIFALAFSKDGHLLSGGGRDSRIVQLDSTLNPTGVFIELSAWYGPVRTLITGPGDMLIVGTTQGDILRVCFISTSIS